MQIANLRSGILKKDRLLETKINETLGEWSREKPVSGKQKPNEAINVLSCFNEQFNRLKDDQSNIEKEKNLLEVSDGLSSICQHITNRLEAAHDELQDLKSRLVFE